MLLSNFRKLCFVCVSGTLLRTNNYSRIGLDYKLLVLLLVSLSLLQQSGDPKKNRKLLIGHTKQRCHHQKLLKSLYLISLNGTFGLKLTIQSSQLYFHLRNSTELFAFGREKN